MIAAGVRRDFTDNNYLWTGKITLELYEESCSFTDPTISFTGVETHQRNLAALSWFVDRLVTECSSELLSCKLNEDSTAVVAQWRMKGTRSHWTSNMLHQELCTRVLGVTLRPCRSKYCIGLSDVCGCCFSFAVWMLFAGCVFLEIGRLACPKICPLES